MINIIAAVASNRVIGQGNRLIWHLPADLAHFKRLTSGKSIIMGRKTFDSIGKPLPNRRNIVISRNKDLVIDGCDKASSLTDALKLVGDNPCFIIGGEEIYRQSLGLAHRLYLTEIQHKFGGDAFFPVVDHNLWVEVSREHHLADEKNNYDYDFVIYQKRA